MEPEIISRTMDGARWFWYVYYDGQQQRREVGVFPTRSAARDAALDDTAVLDALTRRQTVGR